MLKKVNWEASVTVVSEGWRCWRYQWRWGRGQSPGGSAEQPPGERLWEEPQTTLLPSFARSMRAEKFWYIVGPCELNDWYTSYFLVIVSHMTAETFKREDPGPFYQKQYLNNVVIFAFFPAWSPPAHSTLVNKLLNINTTETQHILITHLHCKQHNFWICSTSLEF